MKYCICKTIGYPKTLRWPNKQSLKFIQSTIYLICTGWLKENVIDVYLAHQTMCIHTVSHKKTLSLHGLHWLPVYFRIHLKILLFVFISLNGLAPPYLPELLHPYAPARCLRSADLLLLEVPRSQRKLRGDRAFSNCRSKTAEWAPPPH